MTTPRETRLRFVANVLAGQSPRPEDVSDDGTIPFIQGCAEFGARHPAPTKYADLAPKIAPQGAILMSVRAPVGELNIADQALAIGRGVAAIQPNASTHGGYLFWALLHLRSSLRALSTGSTFDAITASDIKDAKIPIHTYAEQERIANLLDKRIGRLDALIAAKEHLLEKLAEFQHSVMSHLMTHGLNASTNLMSTAGLEVTRLPSHWTIKKLKFLGFIRSGLTKGKDVRGVETVLLPYLRVANVQDGHIDLGEVLDIEVAKEEVERYLLKRHDVLMNEGGDNDKLGRGAVWMGQVDPCLHQNHVFAVRLSDHALADWVARYTSTSSARTYFYLHSKQSTNLASINQSDLRELPVPMPPASERARILERMTEVSVSIRRLRDHAQVHVNRLREYRSSLISAAVSGRLDELISREAA